MLALERSRNERLWFKTTLKLVHLWARAREYGRMARMLRDLHKCVLRVTDRLLGSREGAGNSDQRVLSAS